MNLGSTHCMTCFFNRFNLDEKEYYLKYIFVEYSACLNFLKYLPTMMELYF